MAVKMRLMRMGKTKAPYYRVVVIDGRAPRDGRYIDQIGRYDPRQNPSLIEIDAEKAVGWLRKGAQPTDRVRKILEISGALTQFKVRSGRIHTVGGPAPAPADEPLGPEDDDLEVGAPRASDISEAEDTSPDDGPESEDAAAEASEEE